jgi:hypothetical protein
VRNGTRLYPSGIDGLQGQRAPLGNGVVPAQCAAALRWLLDTAAIA